MTLLFTNIVLLIFAIDTFFLFILAASSQLSTCNFEAPSRCAWYFTNAHDLSRILKVQRASPAALVPQRPLVHSDSDADKNERNASLDADFRVVVSGGTNISNHYAYFLSRTPNDNIAMIVSPFYDSTNSKCELLFRHRILGQEGAELLVTTEQLTLAYTHEGANQHGINGNEAEDDDWIRPTLRARFVPETKTKEPWTISRVAIGTFDYPTRIRIECHATNVVSKEKIQIEDLNVECHVDDLQLINCDEEQYESDKCGKYKPENPKFMCRAGGKNACLRYEALCDFHAECDGEEDESDDLYSCLSLPPGARCNFEELRESAGCAGWRFFSGNSASISSSANASIAQSIANLHAPRHLVSITSADDLSSAKVAGLPPAEYFYRGRVYRPGHFLFFSTYNFASTDEHQIAYTSAISPNFPPIFTNSSLNLPACMIRFFYCEMGSNPFQIFIVTEKRQRKPKSIWSPPKDTTVRGAHTLGSCEWQKAVVPIKPNIDVDSGADYYVKMSFVKIPGSSGSIAINDFTLTPSCAEHFLNWTQKTNDWIRNRNESYGCVGDECHNFEDLSSKENVVRNAFDDFSHKHLIILIISLNLLILIIIAIYFFIWRQVSITRKNDPFCINNHEMLGISAVTGSSNGPVTMDSSGRCVGNLITGNPIYETLQISNLPKILRHNLQMARIIGHGAFGEVYQGCYFHSGQKTTVAIKSLPTESCKEVNDDFETEARILSQFKHDNIVAFYGVSFEQQPKYIVLEYLEGGDLKNFLRESRLKFKQSGPPSLTEESMVNMADLVGFACDVALACEHLETTKFVHRDIAARNCLLTSRARGQRIVKIADFGMARDIYRNDYYRKGGKAFLPVRWMPPEAFLDGIFTIKTDVWAFGVLLWEIFSMGYVPYSGRENHEVMKLVVAGDRLDPPIGIIDDIYDVMIMCWNTNAEKRPCFYNLVAFFKNLLKREDVLNEPIPPIRHRLLAERLSQTPSTNADCSFPAGEIVDLTGNDTTACTISSATISPQVTSSITLPSTSSNINKGFATGEPTNCPTNTNTEASSAASYDSMPTMGDGVCRNVFPPYEPKMAEPLIKMNDSFDKFNYARGDFRDSYGYSILTSVEGTVVETNLSTSSVSLSSSNNDDSTLHGSMISCVRYQVRKPPRNLPLEQNTNFSSIKDQTINATNASIEKPHYSTAEQCQTSMKSPVLNLHSTPMSVPSYRKDFGGYESYNTNAVRSLPDSPLEMGSVNGALQGESLRNAISNNKSDAIYNNKNVKNGTHERNTPLRIDTGKLLKGNNRLSLRQNNENANFESQLRQQQCSPFV